MDHQCPAYGCNHNTHLLMCGDHWSQVPYDLRHAVWAAYRDDDGGGGVELVQAMADALTAVNGGTS